MADNCLPEDVNGGKIVPKRRDKSIGPPSEYGAVGYYESMRADIAAWKSLAAKAETERDNALEQLALLEHTADGKPVLPNMQLFVLERRDGSIRVSKPYGPFAPQSLHGPVEWSDCYSTIEALEAARAVEVV